MKVSWSRAFIINSFYPGFVPQTQDFSLIFAFMKSARTVSLYNYIVTLECSQPAKLPARQSHVVRAEGKVNIKMFMFLFALAKTNDLLVSY